MKNYKSIFVAFFLSLFCVVQVMAVSHSRRSVLSFEKIKMEEAPNITAERLIEVESRPWGIGLAFLFVTLGVMVMKVGTPSPTFFYDSEP